MTLILTLPLPLTPNRQLMNYLIWRGSDAETSQDPTLALTLTPTLARSRTPTPTLALTLTLTLTRTKP